MNLGLGDLAYYVFRPVVYFIDWTWGTDLKDCDVCKGRRKLWNSWISAPVWMWLVSAALVVFLIVAIT